MDNQPWGQLADGSVHGSVPPRMAGVRPVEKSPECLSETFLWSSGSTLGHAASWVSSMGLQEQSCSVRLRPRRGLSPDLEARSSRQRRSRVSPSAAEGGICFGPSPWPVDSLPSPCPRAAFSLCCLRPGVPFLGVALG